MDEGVEAGEPKNSIFYFIRKRSLDTTSPLRGSPGRDDIQLMIIRQQQQPSNEGRLLLCKIILREGWETFNVTNMQEVLSLINTSLTTIKKNSRVE